MNTQIPTVKLSQSRLKELLNYDPETGIFTWKVSRGRCSAGTVADTLDKHGYIRIQVDGARFFAHRLAFLWVTGLPPDDEVDHIDGNPANNAFANLREVNHAENQQNMGGAQRNSKSGFIGVIFDRRTHKWVGKITVARRAVHLGTFSTPELAHGAYIAAKNELHPTHRRLRCAS